MRSIFLLIFLIFNSFCVFSQDVPVFVFSNPASQNEKIFKVIMSSVLKNKPENSYKIDFISSSSLISYRNNRKIFIGISPSDVPEYLRNENDYYFGLPYIPERIGTGYITDPVDAISLMLQLKENIVEIEIVYSNISNDLLERIKTNYPRTNGYKVESSRESLNAYRDILSKKDIRNRLIVIPVDSVAFNSDLIMPILVKESWNKKIPIYSMNPSLIQQGIMTSGIPDLDKLSIIIRQAAFENIIPHSNYSPIKTYIFNRRVVSHLDIIIPDNETGVTIL